MPGAVAAARPRCVVGVPGRSEFEASDVDGVRGVNKPESLRIRIVVGVLGNMIEPLVGEPGLEELEIGNGTANSLAPRFRGEASGDGLGDSEREGSLEGDPEAFGDADAKTRVSDEPLMGILSLGRSARGTWGIGLVSELI